MKVFISWSGDLSQKVAVVFRDWLPCLIQSIVPYVSSEDIDKGARWSSDIAKELEDSSFGILCVTKENISAPWINFEAGALSKMMDKAMVCPFLFNLKRAEVHGPMLQFQSTIFEKEDIKKLSLSLNSACGKDALPTERLEKIFEVLYPELESKLRQLEQENNQSKNAPVVPEESFSEKIIEEILEISRNNQKILIQSGSDKENSIDEIKKTLNEVLGRFVLNEERNLDKRFRKFNPILLDELMFRTKEFRNKYIGLTILLGLIKSDFSWLYDEGMNLIEVLKSRRLKEEKLDAIRDFHELIDFSFNHPILKDNLMSNKETRYMYKEIPYMLHKYIDTLE
jgi:hypothetical protein